MSNHAESCRVPTFECKLQNVERHCQKEKNRDLSKVIKREGPIEKKGGYWLGGLGGSLEGIS